MTNDPIWLTDDQQDTWRAFLAAQACINEHMDRQMQRDAGLPPGYYQIMAMLSETEDRTLRMHELARMVQSSQSRLSHAVSRLEEAGWVVREKSEIDGRGRHVSLTDLGMKKVEESAPGHVAKVRELLFDQLSTDQVQDLKDICYAIIEGDGCTITTKPR